MRDRVIMAKIVNITATFIVRGNLKIPETAQYSYYLSKKSEKILEFPGAIYKKFGHTFLIFKSGKIVCVGGKKLNHLERICRKVAKTLIGMSRIYDFEIKNLVGSLTLGCSVDLELTAETIKSRKIRICYDPELFASLLIYTEKCLVILFHTGKVIFTGTRSYDNINEAWELVKHHIVWK